MPGIDVDVGIELLQRDLVAVAFEQAADRRGRQALAERRHDAAGHEDVFHRSLSVGLRHGGVSLGRRFADLDEAPDALQVLRRVHANGVSRGLDGADAEAVLERAQLLEALGPFERRLRQAPRA